ncbi:MAG: tetratricopeptide repeat protein [Fibromonadaceae bacterium]|nr:tetratricopeptide repeat protein [Fibromonadaceae bacterium]
MKKVFPKLMSAVIIAAMLALPVWGCEGCKKNNAVIVKTSAAVADTAATDSAASHPPLSSAVSRLGADVQSPRIPVAISWLGTRELAEGFPELALRAVENDTPSTAADTLLRLFKLGAINAALGNTDEAITAFNAVSSGSQLLAPFAKEQIGNIHVSKNEFGKAKEAYSSALSAGLPEKYRQHISAKIKSLADTSLPAKPDVKTDSAVVPARRALLLSANAAFDASQWQQAADLYSKFHATYGPDSDVLMNTARSYRNLGNQEETKKWYDLHIKHFPKHRKTQDIIWMRAWELEASGQYKEAIVAYRNILNGSSNRVEEAHMRHALCYYKLQRYDSAIVHLNAFQSKFSQSTFRMAGIFWQGKAHAAAGKTAEAHRLWSTIVRRDPTDYHAFRASQLMGVEHQITSPASAQMTDAQVREWLEAASPKSKKRLTAQDTLNLRRGAALLAIAQPQIADFFLDNYARNYGGNLLLQFEIAAGYALAGSPALSFNVAQRLTWRIPIERRNNMPLQVLSVMFPSFYGPFITHYAERFNKIDPLFVSAVMRQESIFNGTLVSPAGAVGLMQIMPTTGKDSIAINLNEPFTVDSLFSCRYNIRFGTYYLSKRLTQLSGNHVLALASYNAGVHNAVKWRDSRTNEDDDIFTEDIGFRETRTYVKKVMGNYWTYQALVNMPGYVYGK